MERDEKEVKMKIIHQSVTIFGVNLPKLIELMYNSIIIVVAH